MASQPQRVFSPGYGSPVSTGLLSPTTHYNPSPYLGGSFCFTDNRHLLEQEAYDDESSDGYSVPSPANYTFSESEPFQCSYATDAIRTPSATPEPNQDDTRSSLSLFNDPIIETLNRLRVGKKKTPLRPVHGRRSRGFTNWANMNYTAAQDTHNAPRQVVPTAQRPRRRPRSQLGPSGEPRPPHCNIKYTTEELDYIRYQRVDLSLEWKPIESNFEALFPIPKRVVGGLQGKLYRQHQMLPLIIDGRLVFMANGHVEAVWTKTRDQNETRHEYRLTHLFPERAMNYPWVTPADRQFAYNLYEERRTQIEEARLEASRRGTYVEKLPVDVLCGCCPGEDRKRNTDASENQTPARKSPRGRKNKSIPGKSRV
ncbi:hypothetical protein F5Y03DRAFT_208046 [Xylaria venustula]|nr:hypothetical protein F5Y03DRAFT_208046 [Xylaria venustula]